MDEYQYLLLNCYGVIVIYCFFTLEEEKQMFRGVLKCLLFGFLFAVFAESCKPTHGLVLPRTTYMVGVMPVFMDTNKKPKTLTPQQQAKLLEPYIKDNYNQYFVPQFNELKDVIQQQSSSIKTQSESIKGLSETISNMRMRSIRRNDSMNNVQLNDKREYAKLEQIYFSQQKAQVARNAAQINDLNKIVNILLAIGVVMILCIVFLFIFTIYQYNRINKIYKTLSHA